MICRLLGPRPCKCVGASPQQGIYGFDENEMALDQEEVILKSVSFSPWIEAISYQAAAPRSRSATGDSISELQQDPALFVERIRMEDDGVPMWLRRLRPSFSHLDVETDGTASNQSLLSEPDWMEILDTIGEARATAQEESLIAQVVEVEPVVNHPIISSQRAKSATFGGTLV
mmetsp:Transcript_42133/g.66810  ORF Transcript_42133/g.66810 Transcript_42133/m.66810 type:complete len:173 (-) Transcript_42133:169-687(-)